MRLIYKSVDLSEICEPQLIFIKYPRRSRYQHLHAEHTVPGIRESTLGFKSYTQIAAPRAWRPPRWWESPLCTCVNIYSKWPLLTEMMWNCQPGKAPWPPLGERDWDASPRGWGASIHRLLEGPRPHTSFTNSLLGSYLSLK